jgi:hypothetical protein
MCQGYGRRGDMVDLDYPPFFIDRVEDAVPPGPQAPQILWSTPHCKWSPSRWIPAPIVLAGHRAPSGR